MSQGVDKLQNPRPFSRYFFEAAVGPLSPLYRNAIWDVDGLARLNYAVTKTDKPVIYLDLTIKPWRAFHDRVVRTRRLNEQEAQEAKAILKDAERRLKWYFAANEAEILEYFHGIRRRDRQARDPARQEVDSLWGQSQTLERKLKGQRNQWITVVDAMWDDLEEKLNALGSGSKVSLTRRGRRFYDSEAVDAFIPYFDAAIGLLLIVGLFTRLTSLVAAGFLAMVVSTQWPTTLGASDTWFQWIEMFALLALFGLAAGQYAGLDSVLSSFRGLRRANAQPQPAPSGNS